MMPQLLKDVQTTYVLCVTKLSTGETYCNEFIVTKKTIKILTLFYIAVFLVPLVE